MGCVSTKNQGVVNAKTKELTPDLFVSAPVSHHKRTSTRPAPKPTVDQADFTRKLKALAKLPELQQLREHLHLLAELAKVKSRAQLQEEADRKQSKDRTQSTSDSSVTASSVVHHWAKGTGFGNADRNTTTTWNISSYITSLSSREKRVGQVCDALLAQLQRVFAGDRPDATSLSVLHELEASCLLPFLFEKLSNGSLIDLERRHDLVSRVLDVTHALCAQPYMAFLLVLPAHIKDAQSQVFRVLQRLEAQVALMAEKEKAMLKQSSSNNADNVLENLPQKIVAVSKAAQHSLDRMAAFLLEEEKPTQVQSVSTAAEPRTRENSDADTTLELNTAPELELCSSAEDKEDQKTDKVEQVGRRRHSSDSATDATDESLLHSLREAVAAMKKDSESGLKEEKTDDKASGSAAVESKKPVDAEQAEAKKMDALYMSTMKDMQVSEVENFGSHNYMRSNLANGQTWNRKWIRRVASEYQELSRSLPLYPHSSVFLRYHEEQMCYAQFIIAAPTGTPYAGGLFLFSLFLPSSYPNQAPKCILETTGKGSVRFNPNLYNCGKVCLSLLGTWGGDAHEKWNPSTSTLLQLAVSIQSLVFVPQPYFNEPGYERNMGTPHGKTSSDNYNKNIEAATVRWAMLDMLRNPPAGFEDVVRNHFSLRRTAILKEVDEWLALPGRDSLKPLRAELEAEFNKLPCPTL